MRHVDFLKSLEQLRFTGQLVLTATPEQTWTFYLNQGRILYATGGVHAVRRWRRNLIAYCPRIPTYRLAWQIDLAKVEPNSLEFGWEYALLKLWVTQQRITQEQAEKFIRTAISEVLFDTMQSEDVTEKIQYRKPTTSSFPLIDIEAAVADAEKFYTIWQHAQLSAYSPNQAPVAKQPDQLRQLSSAQLYQTLIGQLNGQRTLRDLAVEMRQSVIDIASVLLRCVQLGLVEFTTIADLPTLVFRPNSPDPPPTAAPSTNLLVACIDDSAMVRNMMEKLVVSSGYQFLGIDDPLRAVGILLTRKPDFIFLDLVMPNINGYEICEKLRKISCFRHTPIVILTGSDGYANRLRSNFAGASDFLAKPLNAEAVLTVINKHLIRPASSLDRASEIKHPDHGVAMLPNVCP